MRRTTIRLLGTAAVLGATLVAGLAFWPARSTVTLTYEPLASSIANPERGWYDRIETILTERDFSESTRDGVTLLHSYVRLDPYRDSDIPQDVLDQLSAGLDAVQNAGLKIILRFAYNQGPYPDSEPDATQDRILSHIAQVAPVLQEHAAVIAATEVGFVGAWGEWHTSTHGLDTDLAAKRDILAAERAAFPGQLVLRYPSDLRALASTDTPRTVGGSTVTTSVGNHQDCFLASDPDDFGTWSRDGRSPAEDKELVAAVGQYAVVGGETCNETPPERTNCTTALTELAQMHFTYLNRDYEPNSLARLAACRSTIERRLGYRLELTSASIPRDIDPSTTSFPVTLKLRNTGFASPYDVRPVYAVLTCGATEQRIALAADPRTWDPGVDITVKETVRLERRPSGTSCTIGISSPDAAPTLQDDPSYSIRFASSTVWSAGVNLLGTIAVTS